MPKKSMETSKKLKINIKNIPLSDTLLTLDPPAMPEAPPGKPLLQPELASVGDWIFAVPDATGGMNYLPGTQCADDDTFVPPVDPLTG